MRRLRSEAWSGLRCCIICLAAVVAALISTNDAAIARHHRYRVLIVREASDVGRYAPPFASIVVDGNTGGVLHAANADALRHPASLTKIMTLYLLFERLDAGKIRLDTPLKVSAHAAEQAPTKLGLKPGRTIAVEDAIKVVVTKSANDAAVAIAENLAGDENEFARLMTQKARALGMSHTTYVNASGLPDDDQNTTARDQALLGRAIQDRFPHYYKYFSTEEFTYRGREIRNHNHLLGLLGVDGIKTGYTRDSGFNLVTSVHRNGRYVVAVVLGGRTASERDARMRELIGAHINEASVRRAAPAEKSEQRSDAQQIAFANVPLSAHADQAPAATAAPAAGLPAPGVGTNDPIRPRLVKTLSYRVAPTQTTSLAPISNLAPVTAPAAEAPTSPLAVVSTEPSAIATAINTPPKAEPAVPTAPPVHARGGWLIQIGAFDAEDEAKEHLNAAQLAAPAVLARADAFTERVQKGDKALYRARFVGLDRATAEAACRQLKRRDIECMALKN